MQSALSLNDQSRDRLLLAGVEVFAERGFRDATVREICAQAEVNAASINYYFGGKENLYAECLLLAFRQADELYPLGQALDVSLPAEERLELFIHNLLQRLLDDSQLGLQGKLLAREITDPTPALDRVIDISIRPRLQLLREIVPAILGPGWPPADIARCIQSIMGQCLSYRHSRSLIDRLYPEIVAGPEEMRRTAEHIAKFSLAALKQFSANGSSRS